MKKGTLRPLPTMRYYVEPVVAELRYSKMDKDPFPTPQEAQVWFHLGDRNRTAFVPLTIVNEERGTVLANLVGEAEGKNRGKVPPDQLRTHYIFGIRGGFGQDSGGSRNKRGNRMVLSDIEIKAEIDAERLVFDPPIPVIDGRIDSSAVDPPAAP